MFPDCYLGDTALLSLMHLGDNVEARMELVGWASLDFWARLVGGKGCPELGGAFCTPVWVPPAC